MAMADASVRGSLGGGDEGDRGTDRLERDESSGLERMADGGLGERGFSIFSSDSTSNALF